MKNAIIVNTILSTILALLLIYVAFGVSQLFSSLIFIVLGALSILAIAYTVGKSDYGYRALEFDGVFIFGWLSVMGRILFAKDLNSIY